MNTNGRTVRVLEAVRPPDGTTRYIDQVVFGSPEGLEFSFISLKKMLVLDYEVVHFHWPEMLIRSKHPIVESIKCAAFSWWLRRLQSKGIGIVRTAHNLRPHDGASPRVRKVLQMLDAATNHFVRINDADSDLQPSTYIPHGHYIDRFAKHPRAQVQPGRLLYAGLIRPYKGVEELLDAFSSLSSDREDPRLRIVGKPTPTLEQLISTETSRNPRVTARMEFVPDADLVDEVSRAQLVCLPYRELHNSGMLLVALSLGRPVVVPSTVTTELLAREVGPEWVIRYEGLFNSDVLARALEESARIQPGQLPDMQDRDWNTVSEKYSSVFRRVAIESSSNPTSRSSWKDRDTQRSHRLSH